MALNNSEITIYISNMSEDVWLFIQSMSSLYERQFEINENVGLSEHDLFSFSGKNNTVMVLPKPVKKIYLEYFKNITGNSNLEILFPNIHTGEICRDIITDRKIVEELIKISDKYKKTNLISYCYSPQFNNLFQFLLSKNNNIAIPEAPEEANSWIVDFYGSKSGIRQLADKTNIEERDFIMPPGVISMDPDICCKIAANMYVKNGGVVIKTNKGHAGAGILIFRKNNLPKTYRECEYEIKKYLNKEKYWKNFPIIIEKFIEPALTIAGGYPNVEFKVNNSGKVEFLYYCQNRLTESGVFKGIEIHNSVLSDEDTAELVDIGFFVGKKLSALGYRGFFDIDFIAAKNGEKYVTESNIRRTGGSHVYFLTKHLFGKDFLYDTYVISNNLYEINDAKIMEFEDLVKILQPVLFNKKNKEGLIITGARLLEQNKFGYVIYGKNKIRALKLEMEMEKLLKANYPV